MIATAYILDPWAVEPTWLPVADDGRAAWLVPKRERLNWGSLMRSDVFWPKPAECACYREHIAYDYNGKCFEAPALYVADGQREHAEALVGAAVAVILFFRWVKEAR